jgi:hypothetical protein
MGAHLASPSLACMSAVVSVGGGLASILGRLRAVPHERGDRRSLPVRWIGPPARDEEGAVVWEALARLGAPTYGELTARVAERLYRLDYEAGGWEAGMGLFRPSYLRHARALVDRLEGRLLRIGDDEPRGLASRADGR